MNAQPLNLCRKVLLALVHHWRNLFLAISLLLGLVGCGQNSDPAPKDRAPTPSASTKTATLQPAAKLEPSPSLRPEVSPQKAAAILAAGTGATNTNHSPKKQGANNAPFALFSPDGKLPVYELKMGENEVQQMDLDAYSNELFPASFEYEGVTYPSVKARYRGQWSRSWPKKGMKVQFDPAQPLDGHGSINLNSGWRDPSLLRETLAYHVYAACGVPASRSRLVQVQLNGQFRGVYVEVESIDKAMLQRWQLTGAEVYKAVSRDNMADERLMGNAAAFVSHYERGGRKTKTAGNVEAAPQEQSPEEVQNLQAFCKEMASAKDKRGFFEQWLNVDEYINYLAATVLVQNWDSFNKNHYLLFDAEQSKKWLVVPWDLDRTFGDHWNQSFGEAHFPLFQGTRSFPGITGWNRLADRFLSVPEYRARYVNRVAELLRLEFTEEKLFPWLEKYEAAMASQVALDFKRWPRRPGANLHRGIEGVKNYITERRVFLQAEVEAWRQANSGPQVP